MQLNVVIPILNESKTVKEAVEKVLEQKSVEKVLIVDDGSTDNSLEILKSIKSSKIKIFTHEKNMGKGAAIRTALNYMVDGYLIIQDGDLEYDPSQYSELLEKASPNKAVYGSRLINNVNQRAYLFTYLGNVVLTRVFNILFRKNLTDTYTCFKLMPVQIAKKLELTSNGFEIEAEITAKLAKKGINIIEVPISYHPRSYEQGKKIKAKDALLGLWTFLKIRYSYEK